jgi:hypothetical protein
MVARNQDSNDLAYSQSFVLAVCFVVVLLKAVLLTEKLKDFDHLAQNELFHVFVENENENMPCHNWEMNKHMVLHLNVSKLITNYLYMCIETILTGKALTAFCNRTWERPFSCVYSNMVLNLMSL